MTKASDKRLAAIGEITKQYGVDSNVDVVKEAIDSLRSLGRTERWHASITNWQNMIDQGPVDWAIIQGAVYVGYAAL